jgi:hypothetical protein
MPTATLRGKTMSTTLCTLATTFTKAASACLAKTLAQRIRQTRFSRCTTIGRGWHCIGQTQTCCSRTGTLPGSRPGTTTVRELSSNLQRHHAGSSDQDPETDSVAEVANNVYRDGSSALNNTEESFFADGGVSVDQRKMNAVRAYFGEYSQSPKNANWC